MCYGSEFIATAVQKWLGQIGVTTLYITPGSPWENGYNESFRYPNDGSAGFWDSTDRRSARCHVGLMTNRR